MNGLNFLYRMNLMTERKHIMKTERIYRKGPKQLAEIAKRLTPEEFAELRANPQESSELMKSFQKLAVKRVMERRGLTFKATED